MSIIKKEYVKLFPFKPPGNYEARLGKYGVYFFDLVNNRPISLSETLNLLNKK